MIPATEILVIIVSSVLAIFLIVGIILGIYLIRLTAEIRKIAKSAQQTVDTIGTAMSTAVKFTSPMMVAEMVKRHFKKYAHKSRKGE